MDRNRVYYNIKPWLPVSLRLGIRRWLTRRQREQVRGVWPILPGSEKPPTNWPGWPDGKQFALVLTHDVEGAAGVAKCRQLMELEQNLGFRSSFNLIPKGDYRVPDELREHLVSNGFEVGVHDLYHDGKLYRSRSEFRKHAGSINGYLRDWGAVGFRSGFMLNNLDWIHDLNIQYDCSTFDTDPFEPQPQGVGTIFPFWVLPPSSASLPSGPPSNGKQPSNSGLSAERAGYVELPYTLPQDSTLFLLLQERHPDIWFQKLDWVARHGGMALLNVHPDYIRFPGEPTNSLTYPVENYVRLLEYLLQSYKGKYWQATPTRLTTWFRATVQRTQTRVGTTASRARLKGKRVGIVLYSHYPNDPRPRREAEALAEEGMDVEVICLKGADEPSREVIGGVKVLRLPITHRRESKLAYLWQYGAFFCASTAILTWRTLRHRYELIHAHNMPDFLAFTGVVPKLFGAKVMLDLHDPMPELMMSIYGLKEHHQFVRLLKLLERRSIAFADQVVTPNIAFRNLFVRRGCPSDKIQIVMNTPKSEVFDASLYPATNGASGRFRLMYHGLLVHRHGVDVAIHALSQLRQRIPNIEFHIYGGRTPYVEEIEALVESLGLGQNVSYHGHQPQPEIAKAIATMDLGLIPNRRSPFTEINMPTRIFENLAMRKAVVVPSTQGIRDYFDESQILYFEPGSAEDLARIVYWVYAHPTEARRVTEQGVVVYNEHLWPAERECLLNCVAGLLNN